MLQQVQTLAIYLWVKTSHRFCTLHCPRLAYRNEIFTGTDRTHLLFTTLCTYNYSNVHEKKGEITPYIHTY